MTNPPYTRFDHSSPFHHPEPCPTQGEPQCDVRFQRKVSPNRWCRGSSGDARDTSDGAHSHARAGGGLSRGDQPPRFLHDCPTVAPGKLRRYVHSRIRGHGQPRHRRQNWPAGLRPQAAEPKSCGFGAALTHRREMPRPVRPSREVTGWRAQKDRRSHSGMDVR